MNLQRVLINSVMIRVSLCRFDLTVQPRFGVPRIGVLPNDVEAPVGVDIRKDARVQTLVLGNDMRRLELTA